MGDCRDNMKETKVESKDSVFGNILPRRRKRDIKEPTVVTFADMVKKAGEKLDELIAIKDNECEKEKGRESYNVRCRAIYGVIQYHLDEIVEQMALYDEGK